MRFERFLKTGSPRRTGTPSLLDRSGALALLIVLMALAAIIAPVSGLVIVEYFYQPGCTYCEKTDPVIDTIRTQYGDRIALDRINVGNRAAIRLLISYGVTEIPVVVINRNRVLSYAEITPEHLDREIRLAESGEYPVPADRKNILTGDPLSSVLFSFTLGMMTGLSPCLLGCLVLLIAAAGGPAAAGQSGKYYPLVFGAGIITAYLALAAGILGAGIAFLPESGSREILYIAGGLVAIIVGLVQTGLFSIPGRITSHTSGLVSRAQTIPGIFLLGIIFAVLFAPCAIAPFLILIETILIDNTLAPVLMVPAFSLGILAPFIAFAVFRHSTQERLMKFAGIIQRAGGLLLVGFGIWLILSV